MHADLFLMVYYKLTFLYAHYYLIIFYIIYIHLILEVEYSQLYTYKHAHTYTHTDTHYSSVQSLSRVRHIATPWTAAHQASPSIINSWNLPKLMPIVEKAMATHSSTLAWEILWTEEPGWLQSMGSWRVGHNWVASLSLFTFMHWRRKWKPTPVFLSGKSQGQRSLVGCHLWGHIESETNDAT